MSIIQVSLAICCRYVPLFWVANLESQIKSHFWIEKYHLNIFCQSEYENLQIKSITTTTITKLSRFQRFWWNVVFGGLMVFDIGHSIKSWINSYKQIKHARFHVSKVITLVCAIFKQFKQQSRSYISTVISLVWDIFLLWKLDWMEKLKGVLDLEQATQFIDACGK